MRRLLVLVGGFVLAGGIGPAADPADPPKVTAAQLVEAFLTNEAAADEQYVGKPVDVTGKVVRVSRSNWADGPAGEPGYALVLDQEKAGRGGPVELDVLFLFAAADRPALAKLKPGDVVTVRGECGSRAVWAAEVGKGGKDYSLVRVKGCRLILPKA
jgi:hypothetical protein